MLSLGFIFIIKGLSAAQFWCNASFWNPGEVCVMLRCICLSGSLKRLVEAKPKSLDRHDCSEEIQYLWWIIFFCNIKRERISGYFLQYYIIMPVCWTIYQTIYHSKLVTWFELQVFWLDQEGWWNVLITDVLYKDYFSEAFKVYLGSVSCTSNEGKVLQAFPQSKGFISSD